MDKNNINEIAMNVILDAGNGRMKIEQALDEISQMSFDKAETLLKEAEKEIVKAHISQTKVIQGQVAGNDYEYSLLFIHAQDTIMTVNSELKIAQKLLSIIKALARKEV